MSVRILFVEDEPAFAVAMVDRLTAEGYAVELVGNGAEGFERGRQGSFDLIILDAMLPGKSGFDICRDLRRSSVGTPILMLTARGEVMDKVVGLKLGADDYVVKPPEVPELLARIEALLRRVPGTAVRTSELFDFGEVRVDLERNQVTRNGAPVTLSRAEFRLLKYLLEHRGSTVTREELLEKVWGLQGDTLSRTVDVHMASLRKKLEPDPRFPRFLITVKGYGYRLAV